MADGVRVCGTFIATLRAKEDGHIKWSDTFSNVVVSTGLMHILDCVLTGGTQYGTWYIGLIGDGATIATADKLSTDAFTETTAYAEKARKLLTESD